MPQVKYFNITDQANTVLNMLYSPTFISIPLPTNSFILLAAESQQEF